VNFEEGERISSSIFSLLSNFETVASGPANSPFLISVICSILIPGSEGADIYFSVSFDKKDLSKYVSGVDGGGLSSKMYCSKICFGFSIV
jgi:hypothetical protein